MKMILTKNIAFGKLTASDYHKYGVLRFFCVFMYKIIGKNIYFVFELSRLITERTVTYSNVDYFFILSRTKANHTRKIKTLFHRIIILTKNLYLIFCF